MAANSPSPKYRWHLDNYKQMLGPLVGKHFRVRRPSPEKDGCEFYRYYTVVQLYPFFALCRANARLGEKTWLECFRYPDLLTLMQTQQKGAKHG